jgi:hypothetical protein
LSQVDRNRRSFLTLDVIAAVGLTLLLLVVFTAAYWQFANVRHERDAREALRLAAEAELLRLRAAGPDALNAAPQSQPAQPSAGGIALRTIVEPAEGPWTGMTRVTVIASKLVSARWVPFELSACLPSPEARP